jgi:formylmethanofuran--tetrahydromethanopterin N-formyltransferase
MSGNTMQIGSTEIVDTFAEAFRLRYTRLIVTAHDDYWLDAAAKEVAGYSSSIIGCDCEAGLERRLSAEKTPDGREGASLLLFGFSNEQVAKAAVNRTGQCLMTCPTTAAFDGLPSSAERLPLGKSLRYFGDGHQKSKQIAGRRYWRVPVMDGEFVVEETLGVEKGIGGGNIIIQATTLEIALAAARSAVAAIALLDGVITPFPGGVARSGSKVGSRYKALRASTADWFCPTLRGRVETQLHADAQAACEIVIDGVDEAAVASAMATGMRAAARDGVVAISGGNYGGKLGKFHFGLHEVLKQNA